MIRRVTGRIGARESHSLIMSLAASPGLCLEVFVADPDDAAWQEGETITLFTHLYVRAEELSLYGFPTEAQYRLFLLLLRVNGVGPRAASGLLGTLSIPVLFRAIAQNEPGVIARAPGIGKRTGQKIIMELADKIREMDPDLHTVAPASQEDEDVLQALTQMGFSVAEAQQALRAVPSEVTDIGERIRLALVQLG